MLNGFFLFKQKTAYEMRISDWSSDVCSSDLIRKHMMQLPSKDILRSLGGALTPFDDFITWTPGDPRWDKVPLAGKGFSSSTPALHINSRSEEHTSELQSLMRISYAVFCLKKKNTHTNTSQHNTRHNHTDQK